MADSTSSKSSGQATSMAELMAKHSTPVAAFHKGDMVKGKITKLTRSDIRVDIGSKAEATVLEKDRKMLNMLMASLKQGDEVEVSILNPESDMGNPVVSLRKFITDLNWDYLADLQKNQQTVEVIVQESTKGGFVVSTENGLSGFLPNSHTSHLQNQDVLGKKITVSILELNRKDNKIIFSQKSTLSQDDFLAATKQLSPGQKISTTIANVTQFGIFTSVPVKGKTGEDIMLDGLIHISELDWDKVEEIPAEYTIGKEIEAKVIGIDQHAKRVDLSIKQLTDDPFTLIAAKFPVDLRVKGTVTAVADAGVTVDLGEGIEGILRKEQIPPTMSFAVGQSINAVISEVDNRRRKLYLAPVLLEKPIGYR